MSIKTPRLIRDRCGVYYFRLIVPLSWREIVGKTEIRRSLRTKEASVARQAALALSAQLEGVMRGRKKTDVPSKVEEDLLSFLHENEAYKTKVRIYADGSVDIDADTVEEARVAKEIVEAYRKEHPNSIRGALDVLPTSKCGTTLEQAKEDFLAERETTLSTKGTMPKLRGVLKSFIKFTGNVDVAMIRAAEVKAYKKDLLAQEKAPTTINDRRAPQASNTTMPMPTSEPFLASKRVHACPSSAARSSAG